MNFWIEHKRKKLHEVLKRIDILIINEYEARQLTEEANLLRAAKKILTYGPAKIIIKKGENGLLFISKRDFFVCPAYPLETIFDPTGAGDTFAGGFMGYLASRGCFDDSAIRNGLVYGTIMASFAVEDYDIRALVRLNNNLIEKRVSSFKNICSF
jgi:sugar/nucleoside kinase (ribokinase family)